MNSTNNQTAGAAWLRQPWKGLIFLGLSVLGGAAMGLLLIGLYGLEYGPATTVFTVCVVYFWQFAWSFGGWPANLISDSRWVRGVINWILIMLLVWATCAGFQWYFDKPFAETAIGQWGQSAICAAVLSLFFVGNRLILPEGEGDHQPVSGWANLVWSLGVIPLALIFGAKIAGAEMAYIPYLWFPIALIPLTYFGGEPFDRLGQPFAGIAYVGVTFIGTVLFSAVLGKAGIGFFEAGTAAGAKGNLIVITWTNVGLVLAWLFNMWPIGGLPQPLKGIVGTLGTLAVSLGIYAILVGAFSPADFEKVTFGEFCFLWGQVSWAGIGLFDVLSWGYEDDPAGAGPQLRTTAHPEIEPEQQAARLGV